MSLGIGLGLSMRSKAGGAAPPPDDPSAIFDANLRAWWNDVTGTSPALTWVDEASGADDLVRVAGSPTIATTSGGAAAISMASTAYFGAGISPVWGAGGSNDFIMSILLEVPAVGPSEETIVDLRTTGGTSLGRLYIDNRIRYTDGTNVLTAVTYPSAGWHEVMIRLGAGVAEIRIDGVQDGTNGSLPQTIDLATLEVVRLGNNAGTSIATDVASLVVASLEAGSFTSTQRDDLHTYQASLL